MSGDRIEVSIPDDLVTVFERAIAREGLTTRVIMRGGGFKWTLDRIPSYVAASPDASGEPLTV